MKLLSATVALATLTLALVACDDTTSSAPSTTTTSPAPSTSSASKRIDSAIAGRWLRIGGNPSSMLDTMLFSDARIQAPFLSTINSGTALKGLVKDGTNRAWGEYVRSGDTLYYEALLGSSADGTVPKIASNAYLRR